MQFPSVGPRAKEKFKSAITKDTIRYDIGVRASAFSNIGPLDQTEKKKKKKKKKKKLKHRIIS